MSNKILSSKRNSPKLLFSNINSVLFTFSKLQISTQNKPQPLTANLSGRECQQISSLEHETARTSSSGKALTHSPHRFQWKFAFLTNFLFFLSTKRSQLFIFSFLACLRCEKSSSEVDRNFNGKHAKKFSAVKV